MSAQARQAADDSFADDSFAAGEVRVQPEAEPGAALIVDVNGYEGPLDLLLALARTQKVDLTRVSILALAEQYLAFIARVREMRLEIAADYLVMAAWLAYLKSRLLLPRDDKDDGEPAGEDLAAALAFRLRRLEAMREAAAKLMTRNRLGRDVFARGAPEGVRVARRSAYQAELYDLLKAYASQREMRVLANVRLPVRPVVSLKDARAALVRLVGGAGDWTRLDACLAQYGFGEPLRVSALASSFSASLELAREGVVELRQEVPFGPLFLRPGAGTAA